MAAVAATSFSPLSRALVQQGRLVQGDANAIQAEASKAGVTFIEQLLSELKFATGSTVEPVVVEEDKLAALIKRFGESAAKSLDMMIGDDTALENIDLGAGDEAQADAAAGAPEDVDDAPVVKYVQ